MTQVRGQGKSGIRTGDAGTGAALVRVACAPGRGDPSHRSEQVTQWLCGERLEVEEEGEEGWLRVRGPDGYGSWVDGGGLERTGPDAADLWEEEADRISLGTDLRPARAGNVPRSLPWGARVAPAGEDRIRLPDGNEAEVADPDALLAREECVLRFPPRADALLATAAEWIGVPYLWGGRTRAGVDCSGYVQAVLALHGLELPRDSGLQVRADEPVWEATAAEGGDLLSLARDVLRPGDLLFFRPGDGENVTHVAVCSGDTRILHASSGRGQVTRDDLTADDELTVRLRSGLAAVTRPVAGEADVAG